MERGEALQMTGFMKKFLTIVCTVCMTVGLFGSMGSQVFAAGTAKTDYLKTIDVTKAPYKANGRDKKPDDGISQAIRDASMLSNPKNKQILIKVPAGTYYISGTITLYSNIHLKLDKGATIIRSNTSCEMLHSSGSDSGGYSQIKNSVVEGGTWDGNIKANSKAVYYSLFKFAHGSDITIKNTTLKNGHGEHMIILDGMKNVTIDKVTISNQYFYTGSDSSYYYPELQNKSISSYTAKDWSRLAEGREAIHLDYTNSTGADGSYPMDNTACANITVKNCTFNNVLSGVGSHHTIRGLTMSNIQITENTFKNVKGYAVQGAQVKGMTVKNNTVSGAGEFAVFKDSTVSLSGNTVSGVSYAIHGLNSAVTVSSDSYSANDTLGTGYPVVRVLKANDNDYEKPLMNRTSASLTMKDSTVSGCANGGVWGREISCDLDNVTVRDGGSEGAVYLYTNSTGSVKNCTITSAKSGIHVYNCKSGAGIVLHNNTILNCGKMGIELWETKKITMTSNKVTGSRDNGRDIYIGSTSDSVCTGNAITSNVNTNIIEYQGYNNLIKDNYVAAVQNGWLQVGNKWYYFESSGALATGWKYLSNTWYFFKPDGVMAASEWYGGYWFGSNGAWTYQPTGSWKQDAKGLWFGDTSGWYAKNQTLTIDGKSYTFDAKGYVVQPKKANTMTIKKTSYTFKKSALTKAKTFTIKVKNAQGKVTFTLNAKAKKAGLKVNSKGKVTVPKKCRKGTYKITVKAAGNKSYKEGSKTVKVTVK